MRYSVLTVDDKFDTVIVVGTNLTIEEAEDISNHYYYTMVVPCGKEGESRESIFQSPLN